MTINSEGWLDWAIDFHPPNWSRVNGFNNPNDGAMLHSMVGYRGAIAGTLTMQKSWHFSVLYDGTVYQHYPVTAKCWHSASWPNNSIIAIEFEGGAPGRETEPLTEPQIDGAVRLIQEISAHGGWTPVRVGDGKNLWEHREVHATACPSGRIPWQEILRRLQGGADDLSAEERAELDALRVKVRNQAAALAFIENLAEGKYAVIDKGRHPAGHQVVGVVNPNGSPADPPIGDVGIR